MLSIPQILKNERNKNMGGKYQYKNKLTTIFVKKNMKLFRKSSSLRIR